MCWCSKLNLLLMGDILGLTNSAKTVAYHHHLSPVTALALSATWCRLAVTCSPVVKGSVFGARDGFKLMNGCSNLSTCLQHLTSHFPFMRTYLFWAPKSEHSSEVDQVPAILASSFLYWHMHSFWGQPEWGIFLKYIHIVIDAYLYVWIWIASNLSPAFCF